MAESPVRLNVGCGDKRIQGYIGIDVVDRGQEIVADIRNIPLPDNYADEILSVHVVEHVHKWEAAPMLKEWLRILKPGGLMVIECPNLLRVMRTLFETGEFTNQMFWWPIYGNQNLKDPLMCHKYGYIPDSLIDLMKSVGLTNVRQEPAQYKMKEKRDMRVVGVKP
jgi:predicted SAM-dependent methyltransferase